MRKPDDKNAPDFADRYHAARLRISDRMAAEIVARNSGDDERTIHRVEGETDAELVRRIVATYLAIGWK